MIIFKVFAKKIFIFLFLLVFCANILNSQFLFKKMNIPDNSIETLSILGYSSLKRLDVLKLEFTEPYTRLGLGIGMISSWERKKNVYINNVLNKYEEFSYGFPITISIIPFTWKNEEGIGNVKLFYTRYGVPIGDEGDLMISELAPTIRDLGLRVALGDFYGIGDIGLTFGHYKIKTKHSSIMTGFSEDRWYIALDYSMGSTVSRCNNSYGFLPIIREPIERAKVARENAKPKIHFISQEKAPPGSVVEIKGDNFRAAENNTKVLFGNVYGEVIKIEDNYISVRVPSVQPGNVRISVGTSKGWSNEKNIFILPSKPPVLSVSNIRLIEDSGDNILNAGEKGKIIFNINNLKNTGKAFGLKAVIKAVSHIKNVKNPDLKYPAIVDIGDLDAGKSKNVEVPLEAGLDLESGELVFNIRIEEANDFGLDPFEVKIKTKKLEPPNIQLAKIEIDDKFEPDRQDKLSVGNGNSVIEPGESVEVIITLLNKGTGITNNTNVKIVSNSPDITFLSETEFSLGDIQPGDWKDIKTGFSVKKGYKGADELPIKLIITDDRERFNKELPLNIRLKRSYPKTEVVDIKGKEMPKQEVVMPSFGDELTNIPVSKNKNPDAVAVVIGIRNYKNKDVPPVEFALRDAQLVSDYLKKTMGYRKENIIYLENPTKADLEKVFGTSGNYKGQLYDYIKKDKSEVFVYYTGHGAPDTDSKQAYLVPSDADPNYVKFGGYPLSVFYENLSRLPAKKVTVVIDACFSGMSDRGMIISKVSPLSIAPEISSSNKLNIFSSAKGEQVSSWYSEKRHSLFTYYFLKGLQGDADSNRDGIITYSEMESYVSENVSYMARRLYGRTQTPYFSGKKDEVFVKY